MNYTYLIGNGFDLSLGLRTSYRDFLVYYQAQPCNDPKLRHCKQLLIRRMTANKGFWADLEVELGRLTGDLPDNAAGMETFFQFLKDVTIHLNTYLSAQVTPFFSNPLPAARLNSFCSILREPQQLLPDANQRAVNYACRKHVAAQNQYCFVSFNYTTVFDWCLESALRIRGSNHRKKMYCPLFDQKKGKRVLHMHGILNEPMVLGIDRINQAEHTFQNPSGLEEGFIKLKVLDKLGSWNKNLLANVIDKSHLIIIYGMSCGITDRIWWECIGDWLNQDNSRHLMIHAFTNGMDIFAYERNEAAQRAKDEYLSNLNGCGNINNLQDRVHVFVNKTLF